MRVLKITGIIIFIIFCLALCSKLFVDPVEKQAEKPPEATQAQEPVKPTEIAVTANQQTQEEITKEFIKNVSNNITDVELHAQYDLQGVKTNTFLADIKIKKDPFMGDGNDWNAVSIGAFSFSKELLARAEIARIHFIFFSPENKNIDWAHIWVDRSTLPQQWEKLSYHLFFTYTKPTAGTAQSRQWLCSYYRQYKSAQPQGMMPDHCSR